MLQETGVKSVTTWVGSGVPRFYLPLDQVFHRPTSARPSSSR